MIIIVPLNGEPIERFEDYNELFDCIIAIENIKRIAKRPSAQHMDWSFTIYPSKQVLTLYACCKNPSETMKEAAEENLPLIEICIGDYKKPQHVVLTPNVDMDHLKRKWCIDYCTWHHLLVREV